MNDDLISRESTIEELDKICCPDFIPEWYENAFYEMKDTLMGVIQEVPSAQPKTGRWIDITVGDVPAQVCDQCKTFYPLTYTGGKHHYCPNCGAKMEMEET